MQTMGFAVVERVISCADIEAIGDHAARSLLANDGQAVSLKGPRLQGSLLDRMARSRRLIEFMQAIRSAADPDAAEEQILPVLRCLQGQSGQAQSLHFHHDRSLVTAVLPIRLPERGPRGDLLLVPNGRAYPAHLFERIRDRALVYNPVAQRLIAKRATSAPGSMARIVMQPGNLYVFWGYRSLHANDRCDPAEARVTAIFHYGDVARRPWWTWRRAAEASRRSI